MREKKEKVLVLIGPTAVGKTKTSIELAKVFNAEIISGDSMQIYRHMNIGTAKIKEVEMEGITHHLIDIKNPDEPFSVADFQVLVREKIREITSRGKLAMIVGGTGLYIQSVIYDYQFSDVPSNEALRMELEQRAALEGPLALHKELALVDAESAKNIHPNNMRRVIRALEVYYASGKKKTDSQAHEQPKWIYDVALIGLTMEREILYDRINRRVDQMIEEGLLHEVKSLLAQGLGECQSLQAIGYKEWVPYLEGKQDFAATVEFIKQNSRRYAKRQLTWFRNKMDVHWVDMSNVTKSQELEKKIKEICEYVEGKLQIKSNT